MSMTLTIRLPSRRSLARTALAVIAAALLVGAGVFVAAQLSRGGEIGDFTEGYQLQEIRLCDGTVLVGYLGSESGGYVVVGMAADVRQGSGSQAGVTIVQLLKIDPVDATGDVLLLRGQIVAIMNVAPGSALETAYRQAIGELPPASIQPQLSPAAS